MRNRNRNPLSPYAAPHMSRNATRGNLPQQHKETYRNSTRKPTAMTQGNLLLQNKKTYSNITRKPTATTQGNLPQQHKESYRNSTRKPTATTQGNLPQQPKETHHKHQNTLSSGHQSSCGTPSLLFLVGPLAFSEPRGFKGPASSLTSPFLLFVDHKSILFLYL